MTSDSGSDRNGEDRLRAEGEASQSGGDSRIAHNRGPSTLIEPSSEARELLIAELEAAQMPISAKSVRSKDVDRLAILPSVAIRAIDKALQHTPSSTDVEKLIYQRLRNYTLKDLAFDDDPEMPFPLVDAVSNPAPSTIESGEERLRDLAADIAAALSTPSPVERTGDVEKLL